MEPYVKEIRGFIGDVFLTLPLIITGFIFFLGTLTSNIGLLYLFVGHIILVPALTFLANAGGSAWFDKDAFSVVRLFKWFFSILTIFFTNMYGQNLDFNNWWWYIILLFVPFFGQFALHHQNNDKPVFWFFNVLGWFMTPDPLSRASPSCDIMPGGSDLGYLESMPSKWITHIVFFFGFIFANSYAIFNEPSPTITDNNNPEQRASRQAVLDKRVANRKNVSMGILVFGVFMLLFFLSIRYYTTPCEAGFLYSLIPCLIIGITGVSWFNILYTRCGVRPTDVLGIVQGMISPNMADNPIVCVGSKE
jgi:hypothetical protein